MSKGTKPNSGFLRYNLSVFFFRGRFGIVCAVECILLLVLVNRVSANEWIFQERLSVFELFPILEMNAYTMMIMVLGWILMVCDIPFKRDGYVLYLVRTTKKRWCMEQMVSLMICSACYLLVLFGVSILLIFPHITCSLYWSDFMHLAAIQTGLLGIEGIMVPQGIFLLPPVFATIHAFGLAMILFVWIGMICLICNCYSKKLWGSFCLVLLVVLDSVVYLLDTRNFSIVASYGLPVTLARNLYTYSSYVTGYAGIGISYTILIAYVVVGWLTLRRSVKKIEW